MEEGPEQLHQRPKRRPFRDSYRVSDVERMQLGRPLLMPGARWPLLIAVLLAVAGLLALRAVWP